MYNFDFAYLYIVYKDGRIERRIIKRFSILPDSCLFYFFKEIDLLTGEEVDEDFEVLRSDVKFIEVSLYPIQNIEYALRKQNEAAI